MFNALFHKGFFNEDPDGGGGGGAAGGLLRGGDPAGGGDPGGGGNPDGGGNEDFSFSSLIAEDGSFNEGWHNDLVEANPDLADFRETFGNYKSPVEALKALGNTKALVGRKLEQVDHLLSPDREDATAMGLFREKLGIPDTPEGYEYKAPKELEDKVDTDQIAEFAKWAHEHDVPTRLFNEIVDKQVGIMAGAQQSLEEAVQGEIDKSRNTFNAGINDALGGQEEADKALDLTVRLLRSGGLSDQQIAESVAPNLHLLGYDVVKALAKVAGSTAEDRLPAGGSQASQKIDAKSAYKDIMHNADNPKNAAYRDTNHPNHKEVRAEVQALIKQAG